MKEKNLHWTEEKETISSQTPIKLIFLLLSYIPVRIVNMLVYPVSFFYFVFSSRARRECRRYQLQLKSFAGSAVLKKVRIYKQILSFALCVLEKIEGWLGKISYSSINFHQDDFDLFLDQINKGQGAFVICSHLGNIELLRSLSFYTNNKFDKKIVVTILMDLNSTKHFNTAIAEINPNVNFNVISTDDILPDTICRLQEDIDKGKLVVIAGDRTSHTGKNRFIRHNFLGKAAEFPYGTFLLSFLLKAPIYYIFGLRADTFSLMSNYNIFIEKSKIDLNCTRAEREEKIKSLCSEFAEKLEKYCIKYPYQWYNFYDFWLLREN